MNIKKYFIFSPEKEDGKNDDFFISPDQHKNNNEKNSYIENNIGDKNTYTYETGKVSTSIKENLGFIRSAFSMPKNFDVMLREFKISAKDKKVDGFLIFYDGLVNKNFVNRDILRPIMTPSDEKMPEDPKEVTELIYNRLITQAPLSKLKDMQQIIELVEFGCCALFVDGADSAFVSDIKGWGTRSVSKPITEATLSGPQEAFNETLMINIGLIRKILKDVNLVCENIPVGKKSKTPCAIMYLNGVTNRSLVKEVRRRLRGIDTDYIFSSADIEMFIEDSPLFPLPQIIKTERPDRAASMISEGKVVIIVQGSPFVLVLPATCADLVEASEDNYVRVIEANFMRFVRVVGILLCLFLPASFAAAALYHHETVPTDLLFAMVASREQMPFPVIPELLIMIIAFELIKEASIRIPDPIGSTLGIVGGLILGQAAVSAGIASPMLIIIVSIAGLGSFAVPSLSLSRSLSVLQLVFVFFAAGGGFLGIALGIFLSLIYLSSQNSAGVPFLSPLAPSEKGGAFGSVVIKPIWKKEKRPSSLKVQREEKQPHISMKWKKG